MARDATIRVPDRVGDEAEVDYGKPAAPDYGPLARDRIPIRTVAERDLGALIAIDRRVTGRERAAYFERKLDEGKSRKEALRSLKRHISDAVWRQLQADLPR